VVLTSEALQAVLPKITSRPKKLLTCRGVVLRKAGPDLRG
jgi:hypothetical protein